MYIIPNEYKIDLRDDTTSVHLSTGKHNVSGSTVGVCLSFILSGIYLLPKGQLQFT